MSAIPCVKLLKETLSAHKKNRLWHIWSKIVRFAVKRYKRPYQWNNVQTDANPLVYRPRMGYSYVFRKIYEL